MYMFGSLRPSERKILRDAASADHGAFVLALQDFLAGWAKADWLEEYNVERVGKWIARECGREVLRAAEDLARRQLAQNANAGVSGSIYADTYLAFLRGIEKAGVHA